jgi:acyl-CoA thioester hydrolase
VRAALAWVVRRHEIDYRAPGRPDDELEVRTWVGDRTAATWDRHTEVVRPADGKVLVAARTVWVLVDAATGRPRRIDAGLAARFPGN